MPKNAPRAAIVACGALAAVAGFMRLGGAQERTPRPTPTGVICARPNAPASVVEAAPVLTPPIAAQLGIHGTVQVVVSLDGDSHVVGTRIQSSPSAVLNQAALAATRQTIFQTEIRNCRPLAADFIYTVEFRNKVTFSTTASGERTVSVVGQGTVSRAPDAAAVQARIVTLDDVAALASAKNDAIFGALKAKLSALGIGEPKIVSLSSLRQFPSPTLTTGLGYKASRQVAIAVDTVANAGHIAAAAASLASVEMVAIRYALNDHASASREALDLAIKDAENAARDATASQQLHLGALKEVVQANDRAAVPTKTVPFNLIPIVGGFKEPDTPVPDVDVRVIATVTYTVRP